MTKNGRWLQQFLDTSVESILLDTPINGIQYDSRKVEKDDIFVAIPGTKTDGSIFAKQAFEKGAAFIVTEKSKIEGIPDQHIIQVTDVREVLALLSKAFYDFASDKLIILAVTGTNGKTTTTYLLKSVLESNGIKTGLIGTTGAMLGEKKIELSHTTPESLELHNLFSQMVAENITHVVMEVSSHALDLKRVYGINYKVAAFTNLTHDHMDFHGNFENYFAAKKKLFDSLKDRTFAVVNADDSYGTKITDRTKAKILTYGIDHEADIHGVIITSDIYSMKLKVNIDHTCHLFSVPLSGKFNAYNVLGAIGIMYALGLSMTEIDGGLQHISQVPGRFEKIKGNGSIVGIVDYSHTPDSLENILKSIQQIRLADQKIITVFGCGGDRDRTKRPIMGRIAGEYSDHVIITSDNPRTENPDFIINEIVLGCSKYKPEIESDRGTAIDKAVRSANDRDIILVAGKGHEDYQEVNGKKTHFDDREELRKAFAKYGK